MDEGELWARLVEWSAAAVRKPEQLGPYADAMGESVKRSRTEADDSALGTHEMEQQRAILKQMSQHIRFGAMNKDFFVDKARKYLPREEADEIMDFFLLGRKSERLKTSPRVGLVQEEEMVEIKVLQTDSTGSRLAGIIRRDGGWEAIAAYCRTGLENGDGQWVPVSKNGKPFDFLEVTMCQKVWIKRIQLTFAPEGKMWSFAIQPACARAGQGSRSIVCRPHKMCFADTIKIEPSAPEVQNPAKLTKIEVFGCFPAEECASRVVDKLILPEAVEEVPQSAGSGV